MTVSLEDKLKIQRKVSGREATLKQLRRDFFDAQDEIERRKDKLLDSVEERLRQSSTSEELFSVQFSII